MINIILGIVLICLAAYLVLFGRKKAAAELLEIQYQQTKTIPEVKEILDDMASVDPNYREMVEVKGIASCAQPPVTPYSQKKVAFYVAETYKVSEETREERDSNGNFRTHTVKHEDKLSDEESGEPLLLKDAQGNSLVIETNGIASKLDLQKTLDRFQNAGQQNNYYTNPHRHYREYNLNHGAGYRLLGYKQIEKTIPLNAQLYALGEAYMSGGQIFIGPPRDTSKPFVVSTKSEEELVKSKKSSAALNLWGGVACAAVGIILIITGIL